MDEGFIQSHPVISLSWLLSKCLPLCFEVQDRRVPKGREASHMQKKKGSSKFKSSNRDREEGVIKQKEPFPPSWKGTKSPKHRKNFLLSLPRGYPRHPHPPAPLPFLTGSTRETESLDLAGVP